MKSLILLVAGLLFAAVSVKAMSLEEAAEILKLDNEQIVASIPEDYATAEVVAELQSGAKVESERMLLAEGYCAEALSKIDTAKKRNRIIREMQSPADKTLESWAWKGGSADRYYTARMHSAKISRKLKSLLEFQARRYTAYLSVIQSYK